MPNILLTSYFSDSTYSRKVHSLFKFFNRVVLMCRGPRPSPRSNHIAALYNEKLLFVFGGASKSKTLNDLYSLDFEAVCKHYIQIKICAIIRLFV